MRVSLNTYARMETESRMRFALMFAVADHRLNYSANGRQDLMEIYVRNE